MDGLVPLIHFGFDHTSSVFSILNGRAPSIPAADDNLQIIGVHGVGFVADQVVIDSSDVSSVFLKTRSPRQIGEDIRGSLTLYLQDSSRHRAWILPDLLGMGIVFMWSQADKWAVSSSLPGLISFLQSNGVRITKDADYVALSAATGNGGLVSSPYEEIKAVPPFSYLEAFGPEIKIQEYSNKTELLSPVGHEHYREALSGLAEEIMQNVALLADVDAPHHVCHLTGGLDSRTVLAALLATGRAGRFVYHTGGDKKHQDFIVASQLSAELGLERTTFAGLTPSIIPADLDFPAWALHETGGLLRGPAHPGLGVSRSIVLSGAQGNLLSASYPQVSADEELEYTKDPEQILRSIFVEGAITAYGRPGFLSRGLSRRLGERAGAIIREGLESGIRPDAGLDYFRTVTRGRYYTGEINRSLSSHVLRFDPLYVPSIIRVGWSLPRAQRASNFTHLDLLEFLAPKIAGLPYDHDRVGPEYIEARPTFSLRNAPRRDNKLESSVPVPAPLDFRDRSMRYTEEDYSGARSLGLPVETYARSEQFRAECQDIVQGFKDHLSDAFNMPILESFLAAPPRWRPQFRMLRDLHGALSWYSH